MLGIYDISTTQFDSPDLFWFSFRRHSFWSYGLHSNLFEIRTKVHLNKISLGHNSLFGEAVI